MTLAKWSVLRCREVITPIQVSAGWSPDPVRCERHRWHLGEHKVTQSTSFSWRLA